MCTESDRTGRYVDGRSVTTVPDIPVVQLPALEADGVVQEGARISPGSIWAVDIPHARRITPVILASLGVAAGIAAMALGVAAVVFAGSSSPSAQTAAPAANASPSTPSRASAGAAGRRAARARAPCEAEHRADRVSRRARARSGRGERRSRSDPDPRSAHRRPRARRTTPGSSPAVAQVCLFGPLASRPPNVPSSSALA